ncbi:MAG: carboxypeptidase M32 [Desulfomonilaceae bacterium]|nr:carboxypeptidase M32 [Desulfomonilaceae bacterium]
MNPHDAYERLTVKSKETSYLDSAIKVLHWDQSTYIPAKGHGHRAGQLSALAKMKHKMTTDPLIGEWLGIVEGSELTEDPLSVEAVNIREWRRLFDRAVKIPESLAMNLARAAAEAQPAWKEARCRNDWSMFKPHLAGMISLKREQAEALGYSHEPYDALLDLYERGETAGRLQTVFARVRPALTDLLQRIQGSSRRPDPSIVRGPFPIADQEAFATKVAGKLGYDFDGGRLDVSAHPFTQGVGPGDVRITTRYHEHSFNEAFFAVVHEAGHAMYHQGLPLEHWGTPMCAPVSLGVNESQSRMWENLVAASLPFWKHFYPRAQRRFASLRGVPLEDFYFSINEVQPSLIRVEADEVTYNLHVLLRFEIEVMLTRGDLEVDDLPDAWNDKMRAYLGVTPRDYATGVLQDVHWSAGAVGYFPTYTLGNMNAAQFFNQASQDLGNMDALIEKGEFADLLRWLREKIHSQGSRYKPRDLVRTVTNEDMTPDYLIEYLTRKYGDLYRLR